MIRALLALASMLTVGTHGTPDARLDRFPALARDGATLGDVIVTTETRQGDGQRPVVFAFNGGPGAGSAWLGLGVLGPRRVAIPSDPTAPVPDRPQLVDNPDTLLAVADLVLVDPLDTGFSRRKADADLSSVYDWRADGAYLAGIIGAWLKRHHREGAPVFLVGESYGTERAVAIADELSRTAVVNLRGVILVSQSITVENTRQRPGNDLGTAIGIPTIAATACYFRRAKPIQPPATCAERAYDWAQRTYLPALTAGSDLSAAAKADVAAQLSALSGLPATFFQRTGLALTKDEYRVEALRSQDQILGIFDARYRARRRAAAQNQDPSTDALLPAMTDATRRYYLERFATSGSPIDGAPYVLLDERIGDAWRYGPKADPYAAFDMAGVLAKALRRREAGLMIAGGLYDTAGSYGADRYLASHIDMPLGTVSRFSYEGGHMFYFDDASRVAFLRDLTSFVRRNTGVR